jgi:hypothetical protein
MSDNTPIGTSIIVGVDGIRCEEDSDELKLILSSGIYEIPVKTETPNDKLEIRFDRTVPVPGTFGQLVNDEIDILTDTEKKFKETVEKMLGDRTDEYAELFRKDNVREIGGRGLILLEKAKAEIKKDDILADTNISPLNLIATFIEITEKYVESCEKVEKLANRHEVLVNTYKGTFVEGGKRTKKLARDIELINSKIDSNNNIMSYCLATINAAVLPVLNMELCK